MGYEEMGITQAEWDIAKIIETHVGYETPIQWRIAKSLYEREQTAMTEACATVDEASQRAHGEMMKMFDRCQVLSAKIDALPRFVPLTRTRLVHMFNEAFELAAEAESPYQWWRFKPTMQNSMMESLFLVVGMMVLVIFSASILLGFLAR